MEDKIAYYSKISGLVFFFGFFVIILLRTYIFSSKKDMQDHANIILNEAEDGNFNDTITDIKE